MHYACWKGVLLEVKVQLAVDNLVILFSCFSFGIIVVYTQGNVFSKSYISTNVPALVAAISSIKYISIGGGADDSVDGLVKILSMNAPRASSCCVCALVVYTSNEAVLRNALVIFCLLYTSPSPRDS